MSQTFKTLLATKSFSLIQADRGTYLFRNRAARLEMVFPRTIARAVLDTIREPDPFIRNRAEEENAMIVWESFIGSEPTRRVA